MKISMCVVCIAWRVAPRIFKLSNLGTDEECHLLLAVHSICPIQATPISRTVTEQIEWKNFLLSF